jgi:actin-like ATPase involved in cell morphogenesis
MEGEREGSPVEGVGIDLGTNNSAVAWADGAGGVHVFAIPQLVVAGEVAARPLLPSCLYLPAGAELPPGALTLPWTSTREFAVGEFARTQGAAVPGRLVSSAKSWLSHAGVDRDAPILPWGGAEGAPRVSPLEAQARYLAHLAEAWNFAHPDTPLGELDLVLTVPASFDEVARELTVLAAKRAGLARLTLLEEPLAAFYAWLDKSGEAPTDGLILVCDVGGGTTDFTLIRAQGGALERVAVGDHLLLGGDNMDLALARRVEAGLGQKLDAQRLAMLVHQCRIAKERLLSEEAPERVTVVVAGRGTRLIGGSLQVELTREQVLEVVVEGFCPRVPADAETLRGRAALTEFGLPYAADPAITRHLAEFLRRHGVGWPTHVLWNGGALKAAALRERILSVLGDWIGARPHVLAGASAELAVACGAAYYGLVRSGRGIRVGGGAARAYYVETEAASGERVAVCLSPRGAEEGSETRLPGRFLLVVNRPARFRLFSSSQRKGDRVGDHVPLAGLSELPPIFTALRLEGTSRDQTLEVELTARRTEIGTLELMCAATGPAGAQRWQLQFDLRAASASAPEPAPAADADAGAADAAAACLPACEPALAVLKQVFRPVGDERVPPERVMKLLEAALALPRDAWPLGTLRALWEGLRDLRGDRGRTAAHEARWLNLAGFCLRPGMGYALDDWRIKELWRVWNAGLVHDGADPCRLEWWILWRRVSGGLSRTQQDEVQKRIAPHFLQPGTRAGGRKPPSPQEAAEMWRTVASLERIATASKVALGDALVPLITKGKLGVAGWFSIGRLGARVPLYGSAQSVVPAKTAEVWLAELLALDWKGTEHAGFAVAEIARCSGDRARDLPEPLRQQIAERVRGGPTGERLAEMVLAPVVLESREEKFAFGDALPVGLRLADAKPATSDAGDILSVDD